MPATGGDSDFQLAEAVKAGRVSESWIDTMVDELLSVVMSTSEAIKEKQGQPFDVELHHQIARKAAEESIVLLKNEGDLLPLKPGTKTALIGDFAENPRYQGAGSSVVNPTKVESLQSVISDSDLDVIGFARGYRRVGPCLRS